MAITISGSNDNISAADGSLTIEGLTASGDLSVDSVIVGTGASVSSPATNVLTLGTNDTERMRITSSGNIGINSTNPAYPLDIAGNSASMRLNSTNTSTLVITSGASNSARIEFGDLANNDTGYIYYDNSNDSMQFATNGSNERLRITSGGDVNVAAGGSVFITNGNLVFSTSGTGIDFSATSDGSGTTTSELLDDYEEGTWTPAYSAAFTGTYAANGQIGRYTKIGRVVCAYFFIQVSTVSGSGGITLNGLPFATASATNHNPGTVIPLAGNWSTNTPFSLDANGSAATTYNIKYRSASNGSIDAGNIAVSDLATNAFMRGVIVYES